ncbi:hypothetical protein C8R47DRAFT_1218574 [Mycena vitilis]|nr:hypothetical protein C8R47DRAFT_1218529 [Mycena vitilis]KAJ6480720.1 hypothetical protein C8R47DRAFT_1218574 [Mycena vitilis]
MPPERALFAAARSLLPPPFRCPSPLLFALPAGSSYRWAASCTTAEYTSPIGRASHRSLASSQRALYLLAVFCTLAACDIMHSFRPQVVCETVRRTRRFIASIPPPASAPLPAHNSYTVVDVSRL